MEVMQTSRRDFGKVDNKNLQLCSVCPGGRCQRDQSWVKQVMRIRSRPNSFVEYIDFIVLRKSPFDREEMKYFASRISGVGVVPNNSLSL